MGRKAGVRVSSTKVDFNDFVVSNYSSAHIMQLIRSAKQRSELKGVAFDGLDALYAHTVSELAKNDGLCNCCKRGFHRKENGKGGGGKHSLSLHRVIASRGYVADNIRIICQTCNNAIGEIQTPADLAWRKYALDWQTILMAGD